MLPWYMATIDVYGPMAARVCRGTTRASCPAGVWTRLEKLTPLSERLGSLGIMGGQLRAP